MADYREPFPSLGPADIIRLKVRAIFARQTAAKYPTRNTELQAWLAAQAVLCCEKPADLVLP
jgi:hypothetical protein